ncbi:MAG: hypothetical protein JW967_04355 [Dehalococcoidales bacterium]|nr:hypothetical protein [Dehalococcoidales bacterium]
MLDEKWAQLTPEQKRAKRYDRLLNKEGINFESPLAEKNYNIRLQRILDAYQIKEPDRVPVNIYASPASVYGINGKTIMYDYDKLISAWSKFNDEYAEKLDTFTAPSMVLPASVYDLIDFKLYLWPGHGLPDSALSQQFVESVNMRDDEYDHLIRDSSDFFMRVYLPRVFGVFKPYKYSSPLFSLVEFPHAYFMPFMMPEFQEMWQKFQEISQELFRWSQKVGTYSSHGKSKGFPSVDGLGFGKAPFDTIGDTLRGTKGIMKDMYSQPGKLLQALDSVADMTINSVISSVNANEGLIATFPLHKGADGWMSQKQFDTFYWPSLKKVIDAVIKEGIIVRCFAEGSYNTRLETINQFPKGAVQWWFDLTDMAKAKKILGDRCCIQGNVPVSLLVTGTPKDVEEYCRKLIETCAPGGGYILSPGAQADEAKMENIIAMVDAVREYGVYKK